MFVFVYAKMEGVIDLSCQVFECEKESESATAP
jgi:hypothetical protein